MTTSYDLCWTAAIGGDHGCAHRKAFEDDIGKRLGFGTHYTYRGACQNCGHVDAMAEKQNSITTIVAAQAGFKGAVASQHERARKPIFQQAPCRFQEHLVAFASREARHEGDDWLGSKMGQHR